MFREEADYIFFNNKFAASCYAFRIQPLALTTMSTHFHALVETSEEAILGVFCSKLKKSYALYYRFKYGYTLGDTFMIHIVGVVGVDSAKNEMLYVLKNPVHHYVASYPLAYPYSSVSYLFMDLLMPPSFIEAIRISTLSVGELTFRRKKQLVCMDQIPDDWRVMENNMILPLSYINTSRARAFWNNNVKAFMFDINKNQTDAKQEVIGADVLDLRCSGKTDSEVCRIIDAFAKESGHQSFHQINRHQTENLCRVLKQHAVNESQMRRCLWL